MKDLQEITHKFCSSPTQTFKKNRNYKKLVFPFRRWWWKFLGHIMRKVSLENLKLTGHIKSIERKKQCEIYLRCLNEWMKEKKHSVILNCQK